ncbi:uroporphyrinogen-III synthase [Aquabacterium sp.]|uniref:uroporphyrinogen-III synthase n=1 Tax=Aquabacterium sp. TaxID=1872578 RepID=UPI003D6D7114
MRLLVTRPEPQASAWVGQLRAQGVDAHALPLIAIRGPADPAPVQALWHQLQQARLLMFVSPSAVEWFFRLRPEDALWPEGTLAAAPGPGTARALAKTAQDAGLTLPPVICPDEDAAQFDSETLWPLLEALDWAGQSVWTISGGDRQDAKGRAWLGGQLRARGATVAPLLTYQRSPATWGPGEQALALAAIQQPPQHRWLFSSSEAIEHLMDTLAPGQSWQAATALATHPRIAERARLAGFGQVIDTRPTPEAVAATLRAESAPARVDTMNPS